MITIVEGMRKLTRFVGVPAEGKREKIRHGERELEGVGVGPNYIPSRLAQLPDLHAGASRSNAVRIIRGGSEDPTNELT
jgi:hypothetical protein